MRGALITSLVVGILFAHSHPHFCMRLDEIWGPYHVTGVRIFPRPELPSIGLDECLICSCCMRLSISLVLECPSLSSTLTLGTILFVFNEFFNPCLGKPPKCRSRLLAVYFNWLTRPWTFCERDNLPHGIRNTISFVAEFVYLVYIPGLVD
jgi:hypothetical protein